MNSPKVLSIQSHVVSGYVGNKSAVFPLQLLGFEVDFINSVQFCTHTHYDKVTGQILNENDLKELYEGLHENGLDFYNYLLTGYVGNPTFLMQIYEVYQSIKKVNPKLIYVCDPVLGDNGALYVPESLVPIYRDKIVAIADILTPNQFELELLSEIKINNTDDVFKAIDVLHEKGCKTVVVSSSSLGNDEYMLAFASKKEGCGAKKVMIEIPKFTGFFVGTGDLFAALFLSWMHKTGNIKKSLENTIATEQAVLKNTLDAMKDLPITCKNMELKIIQSKKDIESPRVTVQAKIIE